MMVGIIGLGSVGTAARHTLESHFDVRVYDKDGRGDLEGIIHSDVALVCVSTDGVHNGTLDMSNIMSVSAELDKHNFDGLIIIKSTIQPGTIDYIESTYPDLRVSYVPEFLREKDALEWFANPDRIVYSCKPMDENLLLSVFAWVDDTIPRLRMSNLEAEYGKLAHNAYIATKVTFTCEIERLCNLETIDARNVMKVVWSDRRVNNPSHLTPYKGGFGGKCVPKDTLALASIDPDKESLLHCLHDRGGEKAVSQRLK